MTGKAATAQPVVFQYQRALDEFRRAGEARPLLKRMSELISLLDLITTLGSGLTRKEILEATLLIVMGEMQAARGCLLARMITIKTKSTRNTQKSTAVTIVRA